MTTIKEILEHRNELKGTVWEIIADDTRTEQFYGAAPKYIDHLISLLRECKPYVEHGGNADVEKTRALLSKLEDL